MEAPYIEDLSEMEDFYHMLINFPEDVHKDKETFYIYSHIDDVLAEKFASDQEAFQESFSLLDCLYLPDWVKDAVVRMYEKKGLMKKMLNGFAEYVNGSHLGSSGSISTEYGEFPVEDNVCMENLAIFIRNLAIEGKALEYMGEDLPERIRESEDSLVCAYQYTIEDDSDKVTVHNFIEVYSDNHIEISAGLDVGDLSPEEEERIHEFTDGMDDTDFPVSLDLIRTEDADTCYLRLSYEIDEEHLYRALGKEEISFDKRDEELAHDLFGISYDSMVKILPGFLNVLAGVHSPEDEIMYYEADGDEGYHYETLNDARFYFEHGILKDMFFEDPTALMEVLTEADEDVLYDNFRQRCERRNIEFTYKKEDFKIYPKTVDGKDIVRIVMPLPKKENDCFEINLVTSRYEFDDDTEDLITPYYFTVERGHSSKIRYLCEWDENGDHYNHGECSASISETLKAILELVN